MINFSFSTAHSSIVPSLPATWSPWDQSPLFLQQQHSLTSQSQPQVSVQSKISKYLQSLNKIMTTTNPPHPHRPTMPIRKESVDYSILERSQSARAKSKILNNTYSSKSLTTDDDRRESFFDHIEQNKYFSNSLNCLNMKDC